jgi:hypothetical protein
VIRSSSQLKGLNKLLLSLLQRARGHELSEIDVSRFSYLKKLCSKNLIILELCVYLFFTELSCVYIF